MGSLQQQSFLKGQHVVRSNQGSLIHKVFSKTASQCPDRAAIIYENDGKGECSITFRELESLTNRMASVLHRWFQPTGESQRLVAIAMKPSEGLLTLLLSTLKAGMAYLPLDSEFPSSRVAHILQEAEPAVVVVDDGVDAEIYQRGNTLVKTYSEVLREAKRENAGSLNIEEDADRLAFVLYTSGSTGIPKGVKLPHATVMNRLTWQWRELPYANDEERCVFKTALTFIDSAPEIWGPLLQGRALVVVPRCVTKNPETLVPLLEKHRIQRLVLVPSLLRSLLMYLNLREAENVLSHLKLWVCSGEILPVSLATQFFMRFKEGSHTLANFYGSTEVMGDVTYHLINKLSHLHDMDKIPIGKPIDNCIVYLLNNEMQMVPYGEVGELVVAGRNLASGYIRERDTHKFLDNPYTTDPEYSKIYRTGDYARIQNGIVIYEGRTDAQIKIRGHRVDISEVEKAVHKAPAVEKAVVLCYKPAELSQTLLAFVTAKQETSASELQIESFLQSTLPPYMVPKVIIVNQIPLLINGKIDRQYLLQLYEESNQNGTDSFGECDYSGVPAEHLAKAKVLFPTVASVVGRSCRSSISLESNFYALGGNSLNSIYTVTKLKDQGYQIGITEFITAKDMATVLQRMKLNAKDESLRKESILKDHVVEQLNDSHKNGVIEMVADSFYSKADLEKWLYPDISYEDYLVLMEVIWSALVEKGFSFVIKSSAPDGRMLAVALNFDAHDEPEVKIDSKLSIVFDFLEYLEGPIRETKLPKGKGQILHSFMMATNKELSPAENVTLMEEMEEECLKLARDKGFAGIFTTNTSPLTQQLGTDVFEYDILLDYQVNKYIAPDGSKPFGEAPNDQRAICSWKAIQ